MTPSVVNPAYITVLRSPFASTYSAHLIRYIPGEGYCFTWERVTGYTSKEGAVAALRSKFADAAKIPVKENHETT